MLLLAVPVGHMYRRHFFLFLFEANLSVGRRCCGALLPWSTQECFWLWICMARRPTRTRVKLSSYLPLDLAQNLAGGVLCRSNRRQLLVVGF